MFGLPIPEGMMMPGQGMNGWGGLAGVVGGKGSEGGQREDDEEEEVKEVGGVLLTEEEGERARAGLIGVEQMVLDCVARGEALGNWLAEVSETRLRDEGDEREDAS